MLKASFAHLQWFKLWMDTFDEEKTLYQWISPLLHHLHIKIYSQISDRADGVWGRGGGESLHAWQSLSSPLKPEMIFLKKLLFKVSGNSEPLQIHCLRFFEIKTSTIIRRYEYLVSLVKIYLIFVRWILQIYIWGIFHTGLVDIWQSFCIYSIIRHWISKIEHKYIIVTNIFSIHI